jgi:glutamate synthase domain-containing protein 1
MKRDNLYLHLKTGNLYEKEGDNLTIYGPYPEIADYVSNEIMKQNTDSKTNEDNELEAQQKILKQNHQLQNQMDNKMKQLYNSLLENNKYIDATYIGSEINQITNITIYKISINSKILLVYKDHKNLNYIKFAIKSEDSRTELMEAKITGTNTTVARDYLVKIYDLLVAYKHKDDIIKINNALDEIFDTVEE